MPRTATPAPEKKPTVGCAHCWAAKYCAAFSAQPSPQPPPNCPLLPKPPRAPGGRK